MHSRTKVSPPSLEQGCTALSDSAKDTKRLSIFSIHVHPDGSRIATGGLDAKTCIPDQCSLSNGHIQDTGGDDEIVMIWDLDPCNRWAAMNKKVRATIIDLSKGACFDPVGEFMSTQSDDKSVKIWRTTDWSLEAKIRKPFEDSPGSTFFRRLSVNLKLSGKSEVHEVKVKHASKAPRKHFTGPRQQKFVAHKRYNW
ncbi:hypothetical protein BU15DRAFT_62056 [Melanogaster broomeanus]|nr:hypothetical protein BU15DRAFT_62056 [Melanogaster broomeanus]